MAKSNNDTFGQVVFGITLFFLSFYWLEIPDFHRTGSLDALHVASFSFADGIFVGWADEIAIKLFHSNNEVEIRNAFREATLFGQQHHSGVVTTFVIIGTFLSIGGVIAVWMARTATSESHAFKLGFFAELGESIVYHLGYKATMGYFEVTKIEVIFSFCAALLMGSIAVGAYKRY